VRGLDDLKLATLELVDWYNHRRFHSEIDDIPLAEHESKCYRQQDLVTTTENL